MWNLHEVFTYFYRHTTQRVTSRSLRIIVKDVVYDWPNELRRGRRRSHERTTSRTLLFWTLRVLYKRRSQDPSPISVPVSLLPERKVTLQLLKSWRPCRNPCKTPVRTHSIHDSSLSPLSVDRCCRPVNRTDDNRDRNIVGLKPGSRRISIVFDGV